MHKLFVVFLALAMLAAACSSDDGDDDLSTGSPASGAPEVDQDSSDATEDDATEDDSAATDEAPEAPEAPNGDEVAGDTLAAPPVDPGGCSFGDELSPELVDVVQLESGERESNPSALENRLASSFPEPLVEIDRIRSGGPPPDGIPPIDAPVFQTAASVDWLQCNEPVLSLEIDGEARAYPVQIMTWHELVNDTFSAGTEPVTVSYCPLCNSALAYSRRIGDRVVTFGTSGSLYNSSLVMYDRQTESLWTHFNGTAVVGTLTGTKLDLLPMQTTSWANFLDAHPDGLVLTRDTGHDRSYGRNPYDGYDNVDQRPFLFDGEYDERLQAKQRVVSITTDDDSIAVVLDDLAAAGVIRTDVGGLDLTVWLLPGTSSALDTDAIVEGRDVGTSGVYLPEVDGQVLTFERTAEGVFVDAETGSTWNIAGQATDGPLAGSQLQAVEHLDTFWFAIAAFEPDTRIITA